MSRRQIVIDGKRIYYSRYLMERKLGRKLALWEEVHHIDENPENDREDNLKALDRKMHGAIHMWGNQLHKLRINIPRGEAHAHAKLTEEKVRQIRELAATRRYTLIQISQMFKINIGTISDAVLRKTWKHVK